MADVFGSVPLLAVLLLALGLAGVIIHEKAGPRRA